MRPPTTWLKSALSLNTMSSRRTFDKPGNVTAIFTGSAISVPQALIRPSREQAGPNEAACPCQRESHLPRQNCRTYCGPSSVSAALKPRQSQLHHHRRGQILQHIGLNPHWWQLG